MKITQIRLALMRYELVFGHCFTGQHGKTLVLQSVNKSLRQLVCLALDVCLLVVAQPCRGNDL